MLRYKEIKHALVNMISVMSPGSTLPSRNVLCKKLDTTRVTLDKAINELIGENVLSAKKGSGTYVMGLSGDMALTKGGWCVIVPSVMESVYSALIRGIENIAHEKGINVVLCNSDNDAEKQEQYIKRLLVSGVSGFIIVPVVTQDVDETYRLYEVLLKSKIPFIFCNRGVEGIHAPVVTSNDFYGGYIATRHLIEHGYRNIAYVSYLRYSTSTYRCWGYMSALLEQNLPVNRRLVLMQRGKCGQTGEEMIGRLLDSDQELDAIFCFDDKVAVDACRAIKKRGLRVSDDIGIIGYNNSELSSNMEPHITSLAYKNCEIGKKAAELLLDLAHENDSCSDFGQYLFQPSIVQRSSCLGRKPEK